MRKTTTLCLILALTLVPMAMIGSAKADITQWTWLPPYVSKVDGSYIAYRDLTTASLIVPVTNDVVALMNVSKVYITFDWYANKTLDLSSSPTQIISGATKFFTVSFTASLTEALSSSIQHTYTVNVVYVNSTGGFVNKLTKNWDAMGTDWKFVVYSGDQADALNAAKEYQLLSQNFPTSYFTGAAAKKLVRQALVEASLGSFYYNATFDYALAKTQYTTTVSLYNEALTAEEDYLASTQSASLNQSISQSAADLAYAEYYKANGEASMINAEANMIQANASVIQANASMKQADAALTNAYGYYSIGVGFAVGFTLMGIGVIVYAWRKPKPVT